MLTLSFSGIARIIGGGQLGDRPPKIKLTILFCSQKINIYAGLFHRGICRK